MDQKRHKAVTAAVMAAVMSYIKQQDAAVPRVALAERSDATSYGASGRQQMMEMRRLLSLRMGRS